MKDAGIRSLLDRAVLAIEGDATAGAFIPELVRALRQIESRTDDLRVAAKLNTLRLCLERLSEVHAEYDEQLHGIALMAVSDLSCVLVGPHN
jgi:hypothetical protein